MVYIIKREYIDTYKISESYAIKVDIHVIVFDVQNIDEIEILPSKLPPEFRNVDILVNNAGVSFVDSHVDEVNIKVKSAINLYINSHYFKSS